MKKHLYIGMTVVLLWVLSGCSLFVSVPRSAHIHIQGPAHQAKEFVFSLDDPMRKDTDIRLNDRYTIALYFQWLWYEKDDIDFSHLTSADQPLRELSPWFICKYRY